MKITICGSIAFFDSMREFKDKLEALGHEVKLPPTEVEDNNGNKIPVQEYYALRKAETNDDSWIWDKKEKAIRNHFNKVDWSDAILVLNHGKNNVQGYIGGNTFIEMGVAFHLNKKIFLLDKIPEVAYREEILAMKPVVINNDLNKIN